MRVGHVCNRRSDPYCSPGSFVLGSRSFIYRFIYTGGHDCKNWSIHISTSQTYPSEFVPFVHPFVVDRELLTKKRTSDFGKQTKGIDLKFVVEDLNQEPPTSSLSHRSNFTLVQSPTKYTHGLCVSNGRSTRFSKYILSSPLHLISLTRYLLCTQVLNCLLVITREDHAVPCRYDYFLRWNRYMEHRQQSKVNQEYTDVQSLPFL